MLQCSVGMIDYRTIIYINKGVSLNTIGKFNASSQLAACYICYGPLLLMELYQTLPPNRNHQKRTYRSEKSAHDGSKAPRNPRLSVTWRGGTLSSRIGFHTL